MTRTEKILGAGYGGKKESSVYLSLLIFLLRERKDEQWKGHLISLLVRDTNRKTVLFCLQLNMSSEAGKITALKCRPLIKYTVMLVVINEKFLAECIALTLYSLLF